MNRIELERVTFDLLGESFVKAALRSTYDARIEARDACKRFPDRAEASNARPWWTRAVHQSLLASAAEMHGLEAPPLKAGNFWNYREIRTVSEDGPRVVLTAATVSKPCEFIRVTDYQAGLAESAELRLFDDDEVEPGNMLYVLLLTSPYRGSSLLDVRENAHLPGSVYLAWPSNDCKGYVHEVNLIDRYPKIVRQYLPSQWTEAVCLRYIALARRLAV